MLTGSLDAVQDVERTLRDALNLANTDLNKALGERDRYETSCSQLKKRVAESQVAIKDLGTQMTTLSKDKESYKDKYKQSKEDYSALNEHWAQRYSDLEAKYSNLFEAYNELKAKASVPTNYPVVSNLPDRPKESRSSPKESREDRGRGRDKEREREKRDKKEAKAEKERLSKRFENRDSRDNRPPTSNRRSSFIEGWGPGGRSASANPLSRTYSNNATAGRMAPSQHTSYASPTVPRTLNHLSPTGVYSSNSSSATYEDDYEDGNYHAHPIPR